MLRAMMRRVGLSAQTMLSKRPSTWHQAKRYLYFNNLIFLSIYSLFISLIVQTTCHQQPPKATQSSPHSRQLPEAGEVAVFQVKKAVYLTSLCFMFKVAYDTTCGFLNYRKLTALDRLQSVWNEAVVTVFYEVTKDAEVASVFGKPVVMGAPPAQSVSPLTIHSNGLEFDIVVGPFSIFSQKNSYTEPTPAKEEPTIFDDKIVTPKSPSILRSIRERAENTIEKLPTVKLPSLVGYMMVTVPIVGKGARGKLHVLAYTNEDHEWAVKYAKITKEDGTVVKEIVTNHYVPGIPAKI